MLNQPFGKNKWLASRLGYGLSSIRNARHPEIKEKIKAVEKAIELGYNYFDTAWGYGYGESEKILGKILKQHQNKNLIIATKIPIKRAFSLNMKIDWAFSEDHIITFTEKSLKNLQTDCIHLQQFHIWDDAWSSNDSWKNAVYKLKKDGKILACGISLNQDQPLSFVNTLETNLIDAVQVVYNIFNQEPDKKLFKICLEKDIAIVTRLTFDFGALAGAYENLISVPAKDDRPSHFSIQQLKATQEKIKELKKILPEGMTMAELALRFVLQNQDINVSLLGMNSCDKVTQNYQIALNDPLSESLMIELKKHNWTRPYESISKIDILTALYLDSKSLANKILLKLK